MFTSLSIGKRLYLVIGVIVLLGFTTSLINYLQLRAIDTRAAAVARDRWPKTVIANKIIDNINANGKSVLALMFLTDVDEMKKTVSRMGEASKELTGFYDQLDKTVTSEDGKVLLAKIKSARTAYVDNRKKAVALALDGQTEQAKVMLVNETLPLQKEYLKNIQALINMQGDAMTGAVTEIEQAVSEARNLSLGIGLLTLLAAIGMGSLLVRSIASPLHEVIRHFDEIGKSNLSGEIKAARKDEIGKVFHSLADMQDKLSDILREVDDCGKYMGQSAYQVLTISSEISEVSKQQESRSEEVSDAMGQLHQISSNVLDQATEAANRSHEVELLAREGMQNVHQNIGSMEQTTEQVNRASVEIQELEHSAKKIHDIVNTIKDIAGQTNLLALNAAIEAARAGEQGRGFAVVADEVRKLAERTTDSASEVSNIIAHLSGQVQQVATTMHVVVDKVNVTREAAENTAHAIEGMAGNAVETAKANQKISNSSQQQLDQFGRLHSIMDSLFAILKENGVKMDTTTAIGDDLRVVADRLNGIMSGFTLKSGTMILEPIPHEKRRAPRAQNTLLIKVAQGDKPLEAVSSDFSMTGLRLRLPLPLNEREPIALSIFLPKDYLDEYSTQNPLRVKGRIVRQSKSGENYLCSVEFANPNEHERDMIKKCFAFFNKNPEFPMSA